MSRPLTYRMTWAARRWVDAARRNPWIVVGPCIVGTWWLLLGGTLLAGATP